MSVADNGNNFRSIFQPAPFNVVWKCHLRNPPTFQNLIIHFQSTFSILYPVLMTSLIVNYHDIKQKRSEFQMERLHQIIELKKKAYFFLWNNVDFRVAKCRQKFWFSFLFFCFIIIRFQIPLYLALKYQGSYWKICGYFLEIFLEYSDFRLKLCDFKISSDWV